MALYDAQGPGGEGAAAHVAAAMLAPLAESAIAPIPIVRMGHQPAHEACTQHRGMREGQLGLQPAHALSDVAAMPTTAEAGSRAHP